MRTTISLLIVLGLSCTSWTHSNLQRQIHFKIKISQEAAQGLLPFLKKKTDGLTTGLFRLSICVLSFLLLQAKNSTDEWLYIGFVRREGVPKSLRVLHRLTRRRSPLAHLSDKALNGSGSLLIGFVALTGTTASTKKRRRTLVSSSTLFSLLSYNALSCFVLFPIFHLSVKSKEERVSPSPL